MTLFATIPLEPDADTARQWAEVELSKSDYQEPSSWLSDFLGRIWNSFSEVSGGNAEVGLLVAGGIVVVLGILFLIGATIQQSRRTANQSQAMFGAQAETAQEYLALADAANRAQDWSVGVVALYRYLIRALEEDELLDTAPGRTAKEAALAASQVFPAHTSQWDAAAVTFDAVFYGDQIATAEQFQQVSQLVRQTVDAPASAAKHNPRAVRS